MTEVPPDDVAWADSCLNKDPDSLDSGWNSLKDALFETLNSSQSYPSAPEKDTSPETTEMEIFPVEDDDGLHKVAKRAIRGAATSAVAGDAATSVVAGEKNDDVSNAETTDGFWSNHKMEDVFLPTYDDNLRLGVSDPEADLVFQAYEVEQTKEDIFKIWDLDIPPEEDGLIKQLNKALSESSVDPTISVSSDDSKALKGHQDGSIDHLVAGIADLALSPNY